MGKYGRILPVMHMRRRDKKKISFKMLKMAVLGRIEHISLNKIFLKSIISF